MIGRFLLGVGFGALVSSGVLAVASIAVPGPQPRATVSAKPEVAAKVADAPLAPAPEAVADKPAAPAPVAAAKPAPVVEPAPQPDVLAEPAVVAAPKADTPPPASAEAPEAPVGPADAAPADLALAPEAAPGAALPPAAPDAPLSEAAPVAPAAPNAAPDVAAAPAPDAPEAPVPAGVPQAPVLAEDAAPPADLPTAMAEPAAEPAPSIAMDAGLPPLTPEEEALLADIAQNGPDALPPELIVEPEPETAPEPASPGLIAMEEGGSTLPPAPSLGERETAVVTERLPRIGEADPAEAALAPKSDKPVDLYARPFENPAAKPLFAVILIDTGAADLDRAALAALPFPVTFALDPQAPGAIAHAAIYRAGGQEVLMLASGVPKGAQASDVEVAFGVMEQALPEAVAVIDMPDRLFQADRPLASLVVPVVGAQGRGLVTWNEGLNAADQVARREDVPSVVIFRALDTAGEDSPVIRRYLDRAAFKAAQEGKVTVAGLTRPETVTALLEWAVEGRAATVALAPVTAVLSID